MSYENLPFIVWIVFFGICAASFYAYYQRHMLGNILRAIIAAEAKDPDSAKTLCELGYKKGLKRRFAVFALRKGSGLRKTVEAVFEESTPEKKHRDQLFARAPKLESEQKYYIPEEKQIVADVRYDGEGTSLKTLILSIAALFVAALLVIKFLPWVMDKVRSTFSDSDSEQEIHEQEDLYGNDVYDPELPEDTENIEDPEEPEEPKGDLKGIISDTPASDDDGQINSDGE